MRVLPVRLSDDERAVLRRWCGWHFGDPDWADRIASVIEAPKFAMAVMDKEGAPSGDGRP